MHGTDQLLRPPGQPEHPPSDCCCCCWSSASPSGSGAAHLQPLLSFLHHQPFGSSRAAWDGAVAKPLEAAASTAAGSNKGLGSGASLMVAEWGRQQLLKLLGRVMIRSCKADLALLPPCYKQVGSCGTSGAWGVWDIGYAIGKVKSAYIIRRGVTH